MEREISIKEIKGIKIGQVEDVKAGTGCTVLISERGMAAGIDIRGGGPASRDSRLLDPLMSAQFIHGVLLAGGSAFGLGAANGVMDCLEEHDIGFDVGVTKVPLVVQSDIFDLTVGDKDVRPDRDMGYEAARRALEAPNYQDGNYGAGCGATVGKIKGMESCMKSGIGSYAIELGDLQIAAIVTVNAFGDIYDWKTREKIAGPLAEDGKSFLDTVSIMKENIAVRENRFVENTTIGAIITNASFSKAQLCKIAGMTHNGYARSIRPVHTSVDGDSIYALSVGNLKADLDTVGVLAEEIMSEAIIRAIKSAEGAYGFPAAKDLRE
ncbi:MAG: P1 family peptidase [Lachnospiraceae bacterium]|nr:P1 family peptidase [Lachnospiraceae bacterium]